MENNLIQLLLTTVALPFLFLLFGRVLCFIKDIVLKILSFILGSKFVFIFYNYLCFPGTMVHELAHAIMAFITGAKVVDVKLFCPIGDSLGSVTYIPRGPLFLKGIQQVLASSAPVYFGLIISYFLITKGIYLRPEIWYKVLISYLIFCILGHSTMSSTDTIGFIKGLPFALPVIFIVVYITNFNLIQILLKV